MHNDKCTMTCGSTTESATGNNDLHTAEIAHGDHVEETAPSRVHLKLRPIPPVDLQNTDDLIREVQHRVIDKSVFLVGGCACIVSSSVIHKSVFLAVAT
jgi:hypothetical protein